MKTEGLTKTRLGIVLVAVLMVAAACGSGNSATTSTQAGADAGEETTTSDGTTTPSSSDGPVAGVVEENSWEDTTLTFVGFGGEFQAAQEDNWVTPFAEVTGAGMLTETAEGSARLEAMQQAGNVTWDVVYGSPPPGGVENCGTEESPLETLDYSRIDVSVTNPEWLHDCILPIDLEPELVVYSTDRFGDDPPTTFADFFDLEKYPGKRGIPGMAGYPALLLLPALQYHLHGTMEHPWDYEGIYGLLDSLGDELVFWTSYPASTQMLETGEVSMAWVTTGRSYVAATNGADYLPIWNADSCVYVAAGIFVPKGSQNVDAAMDFLNFAMGAEGQARITERIVYGPTNLNSQPEPPELMEPFVITPERSDACKFVSTELMYDNYEENFEEWLAWLNQ